MAYFLKKSNLKKGTYLQIYESFYDPERKSTVHKSYQALGYVNDLISDDIPDPIKHYKDEVAQMNQKRREEKQKAAVEISAESPERYAGYFPLKAIHDRSGVKQHLDFLQLNSSFEFSVYDCLSSMIYARVCNPCSKSRTFYEVLPKLLEKTDFSLDQMYSCVEYIGHDYEKIIEIYNNRLGQYYSFDTRHTYFDCTNFYFEIDREDDLRRKGPSKESRKDPIVGLGLLLDASQIPIGMKIYPGNESEKPVLREVIDGLKSKHQISGRTIQIADKGLNCSENIFHALQNHDGYLFSRSVKQLEETEQTWVLLDNDYEEVKDKDGNVLYKIKSCRDTFEYTLRKDGKILRKFEVDEIRVATFNPKLAKKQIFEIDKEVEKARKLSLSGAKRSEFGDSAKFVNFKSVDKKGNETNEKVKASINEAAVEKARKLAGYNLLVSSERNMDAGELYKAYHNLWRIEESFRIMKSDLDARPVYLQKEDSIAGHFLICYLSVLLLRILQLKILKGAESSEDITRFIKDFRVVKVSDRKYLNITVRTSFIERMKQFTGLPLLNYYLGQGDLTTMMEYHFPQMKKIKREA